MASNIPVYIGNETIAKLVEYCKEKRFTKFLLVCDQNTYPALGKKVEQALSGQGYDVVTACLAGKEIIADERYLIQVFLKTDNQERIFLAVGSGTLTDLARFVSFKTKSAFISLPTAASVDGFTSIGAPLVVEGLKKTLICQPPIALFADLPTLCGAPRLLTAAGFGDMIGKLLSIADWELGHLLWDERYDAPIAGRARRAALQCAGLAGEIGQGTEQGIVPLMEGLVESGFCMLDFGNTSPAAGAEHLISHLWEMKLLREHRPAIFHGTKVGVASILSARWYAQVLQINREEAARRLAGGSFGSPVAQIQSIRDTFGSTAGEIIEEQKDFIYMSDESLNSLKQNILDQWQEIQEIAQRVPAPGQMAVWLQTAGSPITGESLGLNADEIRQGLDFSHYLRKRFTVNKLRILLGISAG
jgi:glycerol-1-phosphate dehydrogenase [NAD(P)+]